MRKNRFLLLLVLLMTAATGAWAEDIVISPASGADISTALATATDGKTVGNITINLAQNGAYTVSSAMEVPAGLTINGNGATINAESLTEGNGMFLGTGKDSPTRADIQISDLTIKSLGKTLYYSNGQNNYGDFIMNNCLVEVTSSVIVFNYTKGSAVVNLTLTNSTFYAPTATTTQFYSSQSGQKLTAINYDATQEFSFQNCTLYNMAKNKNFFVHRQNNQKWLSYEAKNSIFVNCGKSGEVVKGMNGGSANVNPTWSIDGNLFNYDGADTSANETTGDTSEGEGVQNSVAGVVTFKDPSNGDFSGIITKSDNSTVDLTLGDPRWTAAAAPTTYKVSMKDGVKDADKWTISPNPAPEGSPVTIQYTGRLKVKGVKATSDAGAPAAPATGNSVDLSTLTADYVAQNGDVLTGETTSYEVTIAAGATVTLDGVTINGSSYCIKCAGDATIILKDGSTNTLTNTGGDYPALSIGDANTTLTIQGSTGVLNVSSGMYCAGIGGGYSNTNSTCGNIRIEGGVITAQGGYGGAGIGTDAGPATCGDIIITGGTITAKAGDRAAGIGTGASDGSPVVCGDITIANTVTKVTATKGAEAPQSIGKGYGGNATCGTVTIGGTKYWENNAAVNGGDTYLATSPLIYDPTAQAKPAATVTTAPTGAAIVGVGKETALVSGGVADGGTLWYAVTTTNTKPTSTAGFSDAVPTAKDITASGTVYVWYYVKADDTHSDSEIAGPVSVTLVEEITWDATNVSDLRVMGTFESYTKEGVTLSANAEMNEARWRNKGNPTKDGIEFVVMESGGYTFTAPTGKKFTKIEMTLTFFAGWDNANLGTGWAYGEDEMNDIYKVTWTGTAASTVGLLTGADNFFGERVKSIAFTLVDAE